MPKTLSKLFLVGLMTTLLLGACTSNGATQTVTPFAPTEIVLPTPVIDVNQAPDVEAAAKAYLAFWTVEDYQSMYAMLSNLTRDAFTVEAFTQKHLDTANALTLKSLDTSILAYMLKPETSQVNYHITYETNLLGKIERDPVMNLILEDDTWRVQWEEGMMLPELKGGNVLSIDYTTPTRGSIYSNNDYPLVSQTEARALFVVPGRVDPTTEDEMVTFLA
ncbi:MAG: NTF2-like N-terminal transpeptidase domain-containing protein, partial [Anaerolineaceae bacterium]